MGPAMARFDIASLTAFVAVAEHRSFTKAAAKVEIALPTMSQTIRGLEDQLGVRLFNRTTRSVALTQAGEQLLAEVQPILDGLDQAIENVNAFRDTPAGTLRLAVARSAAVIMDAGHGRPLMRPFLEAYPGVNVDITVDETVSDIVKGRFDAGVRLGQLVERDMTALRISDDFRLLAVAAPDYVRRRGRPATPADLHDHDCIQTRLPWDGSVRPWLFSRGGQDMEVSTRGRLTMNDLDMVLNAALDGIGVACLAEPMVAQHLREGRLVSLLDDWGRTLSGAFLYHPSRRQPPMPLQVFIRYIEGWRRQAQAERRRG
jgi:DNA-binding transcriptional LysR family regulator